MIFLLGSFGKNILRLGCLDGLSSSIAKSSSRDPNDLADRCWPLYSFLFKALDFFKISYIELMFVDGVVEGSKMFFTLLLLLRLFSNYYALLRVW